MTSLIDSIMPTTAEAEGLARQMAVIEEAWGELFPLRIKDHVRPYESQPYLFLAAFPQLTRQDLELVAVAERLLLGYMLVLDDVVDGPFDPMQTATGALRAHAMRFEADHLLYQLFPPDLPFWRRFRSYLVDHSRACIEERRFAQGLRPWVEYSEDVALRIARGKNSVAQVTVEALVALSGDDRLRASLAASVIHHYTAWQMWDDLCDWKDDLRAGVPSLLLARILHEQPPVAEREGLIRTLKREVFYEGHAEYVLDLALHLLDEADREASVVAHLAWREAIARLRAECTSLRQDVERIVRSNLKRVREQPVFQLSLPKPGNRWQALAWNAVSFVIQQWHLGFGEARHILQLPGGAGVDEESNYHFGDVFQRALIADALCDADEVLNGALQPLLQHEAHYLLGQRDKSGIGGWRYFQSASDMAPDADDLGQVMQVLLRAGLRKDVELTCEGPLAAVTDHCMRDDGSFSTWIIPSQDRTPEQQRQVEFHKSGKGPDNEVVANLLYALVLYDPGRFAKMIERGIHWLETRQDEDGSWSSSWYYGPFYGTYVCLRLLTRTRPDSPAIAAARRFLETSQRVDGGWGTEEASDPLSTALAVLGLHSIEGLHTEPSAAVERALPCFERSCDSTPWPKVLFIKPPYASRTMTATYVLKAAIAASKTSLPSLASSMEELLV